MFEQSERMSRLCWSVTLLTRKDELRGGKKPFKGRNNDQEKLKQTG